jgi:hypothetical protein
MHRPFTESLYAVMAGKAMTLFRIGV